MKLFPLSKLVLDFDTRNSPQISKSAIKNVFHTNLYAIGKLYGQFCCKSNLLVKQDSAEIMIAFEKNRHKKNRHKLFAVLDG